MNQGSSKIFNKHQAEGATGWPLFGGSLCAQMCENSQSTKLGRSLKKMGEISEEKRIGVAWISPVLHHIPTTTTGTHSLHS
jgi:hypothetical protein